MTDAMTQHREWAEAEFARRQAAGQHKPKASPKLSVLADSIRAKIAKRENNKQA